VIHSREKILSAAQMYGWQREGVSLNNDLKFYMPPSPTSRATFGETIYVYLDPTPRGDVVYEVWVNNGVTQLKGGADAVCRYLRSRGRTGK
jgi:hypothetical protein